MRAQSRPLQLTCLISVKVNFLPKAEDKLKSSLPKGVRDRLPKINDKEIVTDIKRAMPDLNIPALKSKNNANTHRNTVNTSIIANELCLTRKPKNSKV